MTGSQENIHSSLWESIINYGKNFKHSTAKKQENKEKRQKWKTVAKCVHTVLIKYKADVLWNTYKYESSAKINWENTILNQTL